MQGQPQPTGPGADHARPPSHPRGHRRRAALYTIGEAAELLRARVATLRYWRHLGTGPRSFLLCRRVLYRRDDLRAWIPAQRTAGVTTAGGPVSGR